MAQRKYPLREEIRGEEESVALTGSADDAMVPDADVGRAGSMV